MWQDAIGERFRSAETLAMGLVVTGAVLWVFDYIAARRSTVRRASYIDSLLIGLAQIVALIPGVSRSGVTMGAARGRGLSRKQAAQFSFLLSGPIIAGAGLASIPALVSAGSFPVSLLVVGVLVSFGSGLAAIHGLITWVEKISFTPFVIYLIALAIIVLYVG